MYPTKSVLDYINEMNRLFPKTSENDTFLPTTPDRQSQVFNQLVRSSSSTDTSPESLDLNGYRFFSPEQNVQSPARPNQSPARPDHSRRSNQRLDFPSNHIDQFQLQMNETPLAPRRERPIIGRKLIPENKQDEISNVWTGEFNTPTNEHMNQMYYELFPSDAKGINEFRPARTSSFSSLKPLCSPKPAMSSYASSMTQWTETMSDVSGLSMSPPSTFYLTSPGSSASPQPMVSSQLFFNEPFQGPSSLSHGTGQTQGNKMCTFCRKNGETPLVYMTHAVKEKIGGKHIVTCPILRSHVCTTCGTSGDNAHTITYCPVLRNTNNGKPLQSTTITLKNTRVKSNGRRRF